MIEKKGRGFALGLQMERTMLVKPRAPLSKFRSLGAETLADRHQSICPGDFLGETEGAEMMTTFTCPL